MLIVTLLLTADPLLFGWAKGEIAFRDYRGIVAGDTFEPRTLETIAGEKIRVPAEDGLTVVLFWATWSPRSRSALELWERYAGEYSQHPLTVLTVNADNQRMEPSDIQRIESYIRDNNVNLPVIVDYGLELFNEIGVVVNPTSLYFNDEGELVFKLPSLPTSAALDLKDELEIRLGIRERETEEEKEKRGKLAYQPKNNALLYYNRAVNLWKKGFPEKARDRMIISLKRDPDYTDPLRALEGMAFSDGRTPETEEALKDLLVKNGLEELVDRIGQGEPFTVKIKKKADPMERMKQLLGQ